MAKTILIPIDFKVECLNTLKLALAHSEETGLKVLLVYSETLSDSITDLVFYSAEKRIRALTGPEFKKALDILTNRFETRVSTISIVLLHSPGKGFLHHFLEANQVNEIYLPKKYELRPGRGGFNPVPVIKMSGLPIHEMEWEPGSFTNGVSELDALFN